MSIGGDGRSEVAAILICVNNWGRLCGNIVEASPGSVSRVTNTVVVSHLLRVSETILDSVQAQSISVEAVYFDESFHQLATAMPIPIKAVIGPVMDHVVVLLIWLPPSTPNPWSAQIRPNSARISPTVNVATKILLIQGSYPRVGQLLPARASSGHG
jgi:hypothetical protein